MENITRVEKPARGGQKLNPCPFCGSDEIVYAEYESGAGLRWRVVCSGCMATVDPGYAQSKGQVQKLWNRRA